MISEFPNKGPTTGLTTESCLTWPTPPSVPYFGYQQQSVFEPQFDLKVRKVRNGFVVKFKGEEHVFQTVEGLSEFMKASLTDE